MKIFLKSLFNFLILLVVVVIVFTLYGYFEVNVKGKSFVNYFGYSFFEGGRGILYELMNIYHFVLFFCTSACFLLHRSKWSLPKAYFALNIFGGFLFHMIWEAQSRYILGYFVLMLPLAACGCERLLIWIENKTAVKVMKEENRDETA